MDSVIAPTLTQAGDDLLKGRDHVPGDPLSARRCRQQPWARAPGRTGRICDENVLQPAGIACKGRLPIHRSLSFMQIEVPHRPAHSVKDFAVQYVMIVLGILTAIGLEQVVTSVHHHSLAEQAAAEIDSELQLNLQEMGDSIKSNEQRLGGATALATALIADIQGGRATPDSLREQLKNLMPFVAISMPGFRRNAWETATANQALTYLSVTDLRRFAEAYTDQAAVGQTALQLVNNGEWVTRLSDASVESRIGRADAVTVLKAIDGYLVVLKSVNSNLIELQKRLRVSVSKEKAPRSASAPK